MYKSTDIKIMEHERLKMGNMYFKTFFLKIIIF